MPRKKKVLKSSLIPKQQDNKVSYNQPNYLNFTEEQKNAHELYKTNEILFLIGAAGTGKTSAAVNWAVYDLLKSQKEKLVICRPTVEAGENLGFLPGDMNEKVFPYMLPIYDTLDRLVGKESPTRKLIAEKCEIAPLAFMRGRTFNDAICILDEAQNCTPIQLKLFLTRIGRNSKLLITGDPSQSDLPGGNSGLIETIKKLEGITNIASYFFSNKDIVRNPLISKIVEKI